MKRVAAVTGVCALALSLAATGAFAGNGKPSPKKLAKRQCKVEKKQMGAKQFKLTYGSKSGKKAMRACKRGALNEVNGEFKNAAHECKAELNDPDFATEHGGMTFAEFYGKNHNMRNAFGKCVSGKVRAEAAQDREDVRNAARECRQERGDEDFATEHGGMTFREFYGTNRNKRNAFGKCVSRKARHLDSQSDGQSDDQSETETTTTA